ncbi:MAG: hypothetical protein QM728_11570 [Gordonia sp. (in: high G+C Gram-positive bacteria)]|uniref:hypothetical protein n=1 Tax=Gordonia sp. (in: high G+C Gram-positive bacteria) TaxID=84139 RepID=UPI0039E46EB8
MTATTNIQRRSAAADAAAAADDRRRLALLAVAALVALAMLVVAGRQWSDYRTDASARGQRDAAAAAAPGIIADVFSYAPQTVAADSRRARERVSERFATANAAALSDQRSGSVRWKARTVGVEDSGPDWAEVLAVVEVADPQHGTLADDRIVSARLIRSGGRWLLDAVELVR